jgi:hypothetical protein
MLPLPSTSKQKLNECLSFNIHNWVSMRERKWLCICECKNKNVWVYCFLVRSEALTAVLLKIQVFLNMTLVVGYFLLLECNTILRSVGKYSSTQRHIPEDLNVDKLYLLLENQVSDRISKGNVSVFTALHWGEIPVKTLKCLQQPLERWPEKP